MQTQTSAPTADGIMARLKAETRHQHESTEGDVDLMRPDFSIDDYRDLLVKFYGFYKPFEERVRSAISEHPIEFDHHQRLNTPRIEKDLRHLGMSDDEIADIKLSDEIPRLDSRERIFGSLYVIEGSTLGGQVISRHLRENLGLEAESGSAFFSGYGRETGPMWKAFGAAVTAFAEASDNHDEIIAGARETFEKIGRSLRG